MLDHRNHKSSPRLHKHLARIRDVLWHRPGAEHGHHESDGPAPSRFPALTPRPQEKRLSNAVYGAALDAAAMPPKQRAEKLQGPSDRRSKNVSQEASVTQPVRTSHHRLEEMQQAILQIFCRAFPIGDGDDLHSTIQVVKGHLFKRDFAAAFSQPEYLAAYALRWSASRALAYLHILTDTDLRCVWDGLRPPSPTASQLSSSPACKLVCLGGGAGAELVAAAATARHLSLSRMQIDLIDIADWSSILQQLFECLTQAPHLSAFAGAAARASNTPLVAADQLTMCFKQDDILTLDLENLEMRLAGAGLVTLMFTLNELFTNSVAKTTAFLLALTEAMQPQSWLLVVDSPGSYSEITLGKEAQPRRYPMRWLLDHTLLEVAGHDQDGGCKWVKEVSDESRWFRIKKEFKYPIELENMRYQIHLFHRQGWRETNAHEKEMHRQEAQCV